MIARRALLATPLAVLARRSHAQPAGHLQQAIADFVPPQHADTLQLMELLAVQESSRRSLLPERFATLAPAEVSARIAELKRRVR